MSPQPKQFILPDLLALPLMKAATNPFYEQAAQESSAWVNNYNVFTDRKRAFFVLGSNELLVSHAYPYAGYEQFRATCDFVNLLFVVDELSDEQDGKDASDTGKIFFNAMEDPNWDDQSAISKMTKEFRTRLNRHAGPKSMARFLKHWENYIACVAREAELRERGEVLDVESFIPLRRENSAVRLCFSLIESAFGTDLPDEVFEDSTFMEIYWAAVDLVCWSNDVYSYDMEQSKGQSGNNIVTVLMNEKRFDLQAASDYVGGHCKELTESFIGAQTRLPSWGPSVDAQVALFMEGLAYWVRGNLDWSFETQRYFGSKHMEIKETRFVTLRPREYPDDESESDSE